jgi:pilus assembly protein Flp/PilA
MASNTALTSARCDGQKRNKRRHNMKSKIKKFIKDESGATLVEYAIIVALLSVAAIGIIFTLGGQIRDAFSEVSQQISGAGGS